MTEKGRLTKILLDILDRVKHRGNSTKVNWMNFSNGQPMSRSKFESIINNYGLPLQDGDLDIIWANIEPRGANMSYSDFVRFITMETIDPEKGAKRPTTSRPSAPPQPTYPEEVPLDNYNPRPSTSSPQMQMRSSGSNSMSGRGTPNQSVPSKPSSNNLFQILLDYKQQIGNSLLNIDPTFTGFVTAHEFEDVIQRIALVNSSEIQRLVAIYDPSNSGFFNYFTLLSDICNQANEQPLNRSNSRSNNPPPQQPLYDDYGPPQGRGAYEDFGAPQRGAPPPSAGLYDDFGPPPGQPQRGMQNYDDFGAGGYNGYDDQPPIRNNSGGFQKSPPRGSYDDYQVSNASQPSQPPLSTSRVDEIIEMIASRMENVYDSSQTCYQKWRSYSRVLGPQEFVTGARKDFQIDLTVDEATAVISRYSTKGFLSLGEFLKMVGAGSDMISAQRKAQAAVALTEEEKVLQHIARQAKNKDWRPIFEQCDSVERIVQSLRTINIYVMLNDLRPCFTKFGKDGVIKKIQAFMNS